MLEKIALVAQILLCVFVIYGSVTFVRWLNKDGGGDGQEKK